MPDHSRRGSAGSAIRPGASARAATLAERSSRLDPELLAPARRRALLVGFVVGVVAVGVAFRFYTRSVLWLDETLSVNIARVPLSQLTAALREDGAPPLYYVMLHAWTSVVGTGDLAVRSLSGVISALMLIPIWYAARRVGAQDDPGRAVPFAWVAVVVMAINPYAVRYATETRMYALASLLAVCGYLALVRMLERPTLWRAVVVTVVTAALLYTQYWALYLVAVTGAWLVWEARPRRRRTIEARWAVLAVAAGCALWLPWAPTFLYQVTHTGSPWGQAVFPSTGVSMVFIDIAGASRPEGFMLAFPLGLLVTLALFGRTAGSWNIDLDLRTRPAARVLAGVSFATLLCGLGVAYLFDTPFATRYAAVVFPFLIVLAALGMMRFGDPRVRYGVLAFVVGASFLGCVRNVVTERTQANEIASAVNAGYRRGDLVVFCPDQIGPAPARLFEPGVEAIVYPGGGRPERIDWVDYGARVDAADPVAFARDALARVGPDGHVWMVYASGYRHFDESCERMVAELRVRRPGRDLVAPHIDRPIYESMGLVRF